MNDRAEAVCDLVLAVIRLAICDYVGIAYGHDGPIPPKRTKTRAYASMPNASSPARGLHTWQTKSASVPIFSCGKPETS